MIFREKMPSSVQVAICFVDNLRIRKLNKLFHKRDCATDVLAFSLSDDPSVVIADIFVSSDMAWRQSVAYKTSAREELYLYVIHGLLHIAGYDDRNALERKLMRKKERYYLDKTWQL
jgi:probable rRNA maturation factor